MYLIEPQPRSVSHYDEDQLWHQRAVRTRHQRTLLMAVEGSSYSKHDAGKSQEVSDSSSEEFQLHKRREEKRKQKK